MSFVGLFFENETPSSKPGQLNSAPALLGQGRILLAGGDFPGRDPALLERSRVLLAGGDVPLRDLALLERGCVLPVWGGCSWAGFELAWA